MKNITGNWLWSIHWSPYLIWNNTFKNQWHLFMTSWTEQNGNDLKGSGNHISIFRSSIIYWLCYGLYTTRYMLILIRLSSVKTKYNFYTIFSYHSLRQNLSLPPHDPENTIKHHAMLVIFQSIFGLLVAKMYRFRFFMSNKIHTKLFRNYIFELIHTKQWILKKYCIL